MAIRPFVIDVPETRLADLRERLARTRWPDAIDRNGWSDGVNQEWLADMLAYWAGSFDWRAQEARLNALGQYKASIGDLDIHFCRVRGRRGADALPLLVCHGWPGSFVELLGLVPFLADDFDMVIPSMPGFGFSDPPTTHGMTPKRIAGLYAELMAALGYERYGVQGGDWGATVATWLALARPDRVIGIHLNWVPGALEPWQGRGAPPLSPAETAFLDRMRDNLATLSAHVVIHASRPQTLAVALNDSPAGLAAWLLDKFRMISDCGGDLDSVFSRDDLLTNVSLYWFGGTIGSSIRLYREAPAAPLRFGAGERVSPPLGFARFAGEVALPPREWLDRCYRVAHWTEFDRGGHFAAMEQPETLAGDIRAFFHGLR